MFKSVKLWLNSKRLDSDSADVRCSAAQALGKLGEPRVVERLIRALADGESEVRGAAAQALSSLGEPKWRGIVKGEEEDFARLGGCGDARAAEPLLQALCAPKPCVSKSDVRRRAAEALGKLADRRAVDPLTLALGDSHSGVRHAAAQALGELGDPRALGPLTLMLKDRDSGVRHAAARALGKLGDPRAVEALIRAGSDRDSEVRSAAAEALANLGCESARAPAPGVFVRSRESRNWPAFAAARLGAPQLESSGGGQPEFILCLRTASMAEALLRGRPSSVDALLVEQPSLLEFADGTAAARFKLRTGQDLVTLFFELNKAALGNERLASVGGLAVATPPEETKRIIELVGAKQGLKVGQVVSW